MNTSSRYRWWGGCIFAVAAVAQAGNAPLDGLAELLPRMQPAMRAELQLHATQWAAWNGTQRESFQQRLQAWDELTRAERGATRERYLAWKMLPANERALVADAARVFESLPAAQQQGLREVFDSLDGSERRGWLLGPALGGDYPALQPLLAQLPGEEHAPLLKVLRAMTPSERRDLAVLVQRGAPQDRAQMRAELAELEPGAVSNWLWDRMDR